MYRIVRMFTHHLEPGQECPRCSHRTIKSGVTLEKAQEHCADPETSMSTCKRDRYKGRYAHWFDGYEECRR